MNRIERAAAFLFASIITTTAITGSSCDPGSPVVEAGPDGSTVGPTQVFTEPCNKFAEIEQNPGNPVLYAEHEFPGLTAADIAWRVVILGSSANWVSMTMPKYDKMLRTEYEQSNPHQKMIVRDGAAAVVCGFAKDPLEFQTVDFVFR